MALPPAAAISIATFPPLSPEVSGTPMAIASRDRRRLVAPPIPAAPVTSATFSTISLFLPVSNEACRQGRRPYPLGARILFRTPGVVGATHPKTRRA